ncbi:hypothetical protein [Saccharopolyspora shandongensis]|uniref:hypothetical protein n=1 Tax=Saccharopolyspora shandongensis TaxID=418495 RepID=UPI001FE74797|nr:hypothetical protein [Saccharopolyspora shandongensis]
MKFCPVSFHPLESMWKSWICRASANAASCEVSSTLGEAVWCTTILTGLLSSTSTGELGSRACQSAVDAISGAAARRDPPAATAGNPHMPTAVAASPPASNTRRAIRTSRNAIATPQTGRTIMIRAEPWRSERYAAVTRAGNSWRQSANNRSKNHHATAG